MGTYDRLLAALMSLVTLLPGKALVSTFFAMAVSVVPLSVGLLGLHVDVADAGLLLAGLVLASLAFSTLGADLRPGLDEPRRAGGGPA
jgi:hypothetical protein